MRNAILWAIRPFLKWVVQGRPVVILDSNGSIYRRGIIVGIRIAIGTFPEVDIVHEGEFDRTAYVSMKGLRWNQAAKHFELEAEHAVETSRRRHADRPLETGDHDPRDREEAPEASEHDQGTAREPGPLAEADGGLVGESPGRVRPGHDEDTPSESKAGGADAPRADTVAGDPRHTGAMSFRLGVNDSLPPGVLVAVSPDQALHITRLPGYVGALPDNSIIWGHTDTVAYIQGNTPTTKMN